MPGSIGPVGLSLRGARQMPADTAAAEWQKEIGCIDMRIQKKTPQRGLFCAF